MGCHRSFRKKTTTTTTTIIIIIIIIIARREEKERKEKKRRTTKSVQVNRKLFRMHCCNTWRSRRKKEGWVICGILSLGSFRTCFIRK